MISSCAAQYRNFITYGGLGGCWFKPPHVTFYKYRLHDIRLSAINCRFGEVGERLKPQVC